MPVLTISMNHVREAYEILRVKGGKIVVLDQDGEAVVELWESLSVPKSDDAILYSAAAYDAGVQRGIEVGKAIFRHELRRFIGAADAPEDV